MRQLEFPCRAVPAGHRWAAAATFGQRLGALIEFEVCTLFVSVLLGPFFNYRAALTLAIEAAFEQALRSVSAVDADD